MKEVEECTTQLLQNVARALECIPELLSNVVEVVEYIPRSLRHFVLGPLKSWWTNYTIEVMGEMEYILALIFIIFVKTIKNIKKASNKVDISFTDQLLIETSTLLSETIFNFKKKTYIFNNIFQNINYNFILIAYK